MKSFDAEEKAFRAASMCAEQWFLTIQRIWNPIPLDGQAWDVPMLLLHRLFAEFKDHSPTLEGNRGSLSIAAKNHGAAFVRFRGIRESFNSSHDAVQ